MTKRLLIQCSVAWRHRWEVVGGTMATIEHPYTERRCRHCGVYESEAR